MIRMMKELHPKLCLLLSLLFLAQPSHGNDDTVHRSHFPEGFLFGTSTSSYQVGVFYFFKLNVTPWVLLSFSNTFIYLPRLKEHILKMARGWTIGMFSLTYQVNSKWLLFGYFPCLWVDVHANWSIDLWIMTLPFDESSGKIRHNDCGDIADDHYHRYLVLI